MHADAQRIPNRDFGYATLTFPEILVLGQSFQGLPNILDEFNRKQFVDRAPISTQPMRHQAGYAVAVWPGSNSCLLVQ